LFLLSLNEHNSLDFDTFNDRFAFFCEFGVFRITPPLHKNSMKYFGMAHRDHYLALTRIKDKFLAIDKQNFITTWSMVTGKMLSRRQVTVFNFSEGWQVYSLFYQKEYYDKVLLIQEEPEQDFPERDFYRKNGFQFESGMENQQTFNQSMGKKFHRHMLVEIAGSRKVTKHFQFFHPKYQANQNLYFNRDNTMMLEIMKAFYGIKALLYVKGDPSEDGTVEWTVLRNLENFPSELLDQSQYPYFFSPNFTFYLDFNPHTREFKVKHSLTQIELLSVPTDIVDDTEPIPAKAKKLLFYDENKLIVINKEGVEKMVEFDVNAKQWKEISNYIIPFFQLKEGHYFVDPEVPPSHDIIARLQDKYKRLRRTFYLFNRRDKNQVYEVLFTYNSLDENNRPAEKAVLEMSFTYLNWNVIEKLKNREVSTEDISESQLV